MANPTGRRPSPLDRGQTMHLHATDERPGRHGRVDHRARPGRICGGRTATARAMWRCAVRPRTCCWPSHGAGRPPNWASRCSATPRYGTPGWSARSSEPGRSACGPSSTSSSGRAVGYRASMTTSEIATVLAWHDALNAQDLDTLVALSSDDIDVGDADGAGQGHAALLDWARSAGRHRRTREALRARRRGRRRTAGSRRRGQRAAASAFRVVHDKVTSVFRHDDLAAGARRHRADRRGSERLGVVNT